MRNSLKTEVICALVQHLSHFMHFGVGTKKPNLFTVLVWFFVNFERKVLLEIFPLFITSSFYRSWDIYILHDNFPYTGKNHDIVVIL